MVNQWLRQLLMLPPQASSVAQEIDILHYVVVVTTSVGAVVALGAGVIFVIRGRRKGKTGTRPSGAPVWLEGLVIAGLLTFFFGLWLVGFGQYVTLARPPAQTMDVYVVGKQWMWSFIYANGTKTQRQLVVPVGTPVRLMLASRDVVHSFYVPAFRIKQDVVPGQLTTAWFTAVQPGLFHFFCAEYCGLSHSRMTGRVLALEPERYRAWQRKQQRDLGPEPGEAGVELARMGERVAAEKGCFRCHTPDGTDHLGPTWARTFGQTVTLESGDQVVVDPAYLTESMMDPVAKIRQGYEAIMPSYMGELTPAEAASLVEFIRSLADYPVTAGEMPLPRKDLSEGQCALLPDAGPCPDAGVGETDAMPPDGGADTGGPDGGDAAAARDAGADGNPATGPKGGSR